MAYSVEVQTFSVSAPRTVSIDAPAGSKVWGYGWRRPNGGNATVSQAWPEPDGSKWKFVVFSNTGTADIELSVVCG